MSAKAKRTMWRLYWAAFGALSLAAGLCMPHAQAICNVPPYGEVEVAYYTSSDTAHLTNIVELYVGAGCTNSYAVLITSNAPMEFKSEDTNIFMLVSNGIPLASVITSNSLTLTGLVAGVTNISARSTTNSGSSYDVTCAVIQVTCVDVTNLFLTNLCSGRSVTDTSRVDEVRSETNTMYLCESNGTAHMDMQAGWAPTNAAGSMIRWETVLTNEGATAQWGVTNSAGTWSSTSNSTFATNPVTLIWTNAPDGSGNTNREFKVRAWYDNDGDGKYTNTEPHRELYVVVVDTPWLMLTNSVGSNSIIDTTWTNEPAGASNVLYIGETDASNAVMQMKFNWLPENVNSNWFRWKIELTNGSPTTQWGLTNSAGAWSSVSNSTFATNPVSVMWTNMLDVNGQTNRRFTVTTWFDCNTNNIFEANETHRQLYVVVIKMDLDGDMNRDGVIDADDPDDPKEHTTPGLCVRLNNDDDDDNGTVDYEETSDGSEDDLIKIRLNGEPLDLTVGTVELEAIGTGSPPGRIKLWEKSTKDGLVLDSGGFLPTMKSWPLSGSFSMTNIPEYLYIEGVELCDPGCYVELSLRYVNTSGFTNHQDKIIVSVCPDLTNDAPTKVATDHEGHCDSDSYWDILGEKVVGLAVDGDDTLKGLADDSGETPCFVSRTEGSGGAAKTRYFMVADKEYTPWSPGGGVSTINDGLDKYWFNKNTHIGDDPANHCPESKLTISFPNYRAFDTKEFNNKVISEKAHLYICVFDLDDNQSGANYEKVRLLVNDKDPGDAAVYLGSTIDIPGERWQVLEFEFDASLLVFPDVASEDHYPTPKINTVQLILDEKDAGWAIEVDWAVVAYDAMSPVFLIHGASQDSSYWNHFYGVVNESTDTDFIDALTDRQFSFDYEFSVSGGGKGDALIGEGGDYLKTAIPSHCKKYGTFSYSVVCHSKGGLWYRSALEQMSADSVTANLLVCNVVTLSTPHCGSVLADYVYAMHEESVFQYDNGSSGYLPVSGQVPESYESVRALQWSPNPATVLGDATYWHKGYSDLGALDVEVFNTSNSPILDEYVNFDGSKPGFYGLTADADNNGNGHIDDGWFNFDEWFPLSLAFMEVPLLSHESFFNYVYNGLGHVGYFDSAVAVGSPTTIAFSNKYDEPAFRPNDLFVTVASGAGTCAPGLFSLESIITHIPLSVWWNGTEPDATNHGTITSEETGNYVSDNLLSPLR